MSFMPFTDFQEIDAQVAKALLSHKFVEKEPFVYHLTKGMNVERQALINNPLYFKCWSIPMENPKHILPNHLRSTRSVLAQSLAKKKCKQQKLLIYNVGKEKEE